MKIYQGGEEIVREGDHSDEIFMLWSGKIGVYKQGLKLAEYDKKGVVVGEIASLLGKPRTATIQALETTTMMVFEGNIDKLIKWKPEIVKTIMFSLANRIQDTTNDYWVLAKDVGTIYDDFNSSSKGNT